MTTDQPDSVIRWKAPAMMVDDLKERIVDLESTMLRIDAKADFALRCSDWNDARAFLRDIREIVALACITRKGP